MSSKSDQQLRDSFAELAQEITRRMPTFKRSLKVPFPKGHIRKLTSISKRWPYLKQKERRNLACVIQQCDVNQWHLNVWHLSLTAGTVNHWASALLVISAIENLIFSYGRLIKLWEERCDFKAAINKLNSNGVIKYALKERLHELRKRRNEIHIYLKSDVAMYDGKLSLHNAACKVLAELEPILLENWTKRGKPDPEELPDIEPEK